MTHEWEMVGRIAVAFGLSFIIGFEREVRGGPAGDRTFALVGTAAAAIGAVAVARSAGNAIAGIVTGVGFIGGALLFRGEGGMVRGITSASAVLATATVGVLAGAGYLIVATAATGLILLALEIRYLPIVTYLDSRRYNDRFRNDDAPPAVPRSRRARNPGPGKKTE